MEYQVEWKVVGRDAMEIPSQVGGKPVKVDKNQVYLQASFSLTEEIRTEYVLFDAGHSGNAQYAEVFLNGISIGDTTGRKAPVKYCVHHSLIKSSMNELVIRASGFERGGWPDNGQYTVVERLEFSPFKWIKLEQFAPAGEIASVDKKKDSVILNTASEKIITLSFIKGIKAVRLKVSSNDLRDDFLVDELCLAKKPRYEEIKVEQDKARTGITCSYGTAIISKASSSLILLPSDNLQGIGPFTIESVANGILLRWPITDSEHIFGLGENTMQGMDKKGKRENIWVIHSFDKCDKPVPFMLSTAGYGLLLHSSYYSVFDLGSQKSSEGFCFCNSSCAEFILFLERDFKALVRDFTELTGRPAMPPRWVFGYYQSTTEKVSQKELEKSVDVFNKKKIPVDVIGIDPNWQKPGFQSWQWDGNYFPKPQQFLTKLKKEDIRLQLWTGPFINRSSPLFEQAVKNKFVFRTKKSDIGSVDWWMGADAILVDFTNPKAVEWWAKLLAPLVKSGISILKTDGGDTSETPPDLISPYSNRSMRELHNLYPILFAKAVIEGMQKSAGKERILTWIRTGFTGIGRYPCCWGGDQSATFHGGRVLIKAGQQAGLMGIPFWSHDLGGFGGKPSPEYFLRSFQWGLLSPLARAHGSIKTPWELGKEVEDIITRFIRLRYSLLPSLYSYAWHSHSTGEPMMRALVLDYQDDPNVYTEEFIYTLGPDLLIAPIYQEIGVDDKGFSKRKVYLPQGTWYDFWTDNQFEGKNTLEVSVSLETIPVFIRAGAIIIKGPEVLRASEIPNVLSLHVYTGGNGSIDLYEDDGHTTDYAKGRHGVTTITMDDDGDLITVTINKTQGTFIGQPKRYRMELSVHGIKYLAGVMVNGKKSKKFEFDRQKKMCTIKFDRKLKDKIEMKIKRYKGKHA